MTQGLVLAGALLVGCAPSVISLRAKPVESSSLEVLSHAAGVRDPLELHHGHVVYSGIDAPLVHSIANAMLPWARTTSTAHQLIVELTAADARLIAGRVQVTLAVRATMRERSGNRYVAQTQTHCQEKALFSDGNGAPAFYRCMTRIGGDLAGWAGGIKP